jgi:DNA-binding NarL/FixJ family response regulator
VTDEVITIVLADDHPVVRSGLRMLLDAEPDFEVVAEVGDSTRRAAASSATSRRC